MRARAGGLHCVAARAAAGRIACARRVTASGNHFSSGSVQLKRVRVRCPGPFTLVAVASDVRSRLDCGANWMCRFRSAMWPAILGAFCFAAAAQPATHKAAPASDKASTPAKSAAPAPANSSVPAGILPADFAGWVASAPPKSMADPAEADAANAPALKEYGMATAESAAYTRDGESLTLHAYRFNDASGSYGAYSYYRQSGWPKEEIGSGAASNHNRVLFWLGTTFIDATFSRV